MSPFPIKNSEFNEIEFFEFLINFLRFLIKLFKFFVRNSNENISNFFKVWPNHFLDDVHDMNIEKILTSDRADIRSWLED